MSDWKTFLIGVAVGAVLQTALIVSVLMATGSLFHDRETRDNEETPKC